MSFNMNKFMHDYEAGSLNEREFVDGIQAMIDNGVIWGQNNHYAKVAIDLVDAGYCQHGKKLKLMKKAYKRIYRKKWTGGE